MRQSKTQSNMRSIYAGQSVGVLGAGQLSKMLVEAAFRLGLRPTVFAASSSDPAAQICPNVIYGRLSNQNDLKRFLKTSKIMVFENEFVDCNLFLKCLPKGRNIRFLPSLSTLKILQNKILQKKLLRKLSISTTPYLMGGGESIEPWLKKVLHSFGGQAVIKSALLGYDGKGVFFLDSSIESQKNARVFCERVVNDSGSFFAEPRVNFKSELAFISVYSTRGEFKYYPLVYSKQDEGICRMVFGPVDHKRVGSSVEARVSSWAKKLAISNRLFGTFALELFLTDRNKMIVNEIAPRVHNSGHFSLDASLTSQFENHWRAILGMPLGETKTEASFAMMNLLGPRRVLRQKRSLSIPVPDGDMHLHWYGKKELSSRRKMGHVTATSVSRSQSVLLRMLSHFVRKWENSFK